ncbi:hypothetical protein JXA56_01930 [Candidatus Micrarchaeota archaeon]|nr:hypothetical protein [Candidatus Micrarchaeota archaeon]
MNTRFWSDFTTGTAICAVSIFLLATYKPAPEKCISLRGDGNCQPELGERDPLSRNYDPESCGYCGDGKRQPWKTAVQCPVDFACGNGVLDKNVTFAILDKKPDGRYMFSTITKNESCEEYSMGYCREDCRDYKPKAAAPEPEKKIALQKSRASGRCSSDMSAVDLDGKQFCIDKWECHLQYPDGTRHPYYKMPPEHHNLKAVSQAGVFPQVQMSYETARQACYNAGKRLCTINEWMKSCLGNARKAAYPWGGWNEIPGKCNYNKQSVFERALGVKSPPLHLFARCQKGSRAKFDNNVDPDGTLYMNGVPVNLSLYPKCSSRKDEMYVWNNSKRLFWDERLAQIHIGMEVTGSYPECTSEYEVYDMVGSVNELVGTLSQRGKAQFKGGYFLDATQNKPGCMYTTAAHEKDYKDYSVGFRCCKD